MSADDHGKIDDDGLTMVPVGEDYPEIRKAVRAICRNYPGAYWRDLDISSASLTS